MTPSHGTVERRVGDAYTPPCRCRSCLDAAEERRQNPVPVPTPVTVPVGALADLIDRPAWMAEANCRGMDPELFYPERGESTRAAKEVCRACPVQQDCLEYALDNPAERFGIWGGASERERRSMRRRRRNQQRRGAA